MDNIFLQKNFDEQALHCTACKWSGKGQETNIIDLYGITEYREVHCPQCDSFLGSLKKEDTLGGESAGPLSFQLGG